MSVPDFFTDALCAQVDPELWFPPQGGSHADAQRICATCPVQATCLNYAVDRPGLGGVWGGTTPQQRGRIRAARERTAS